MFIKGTHKEIELILTKIRETNKCKYNVVRIPTDCVDCDCTIIPINNVNIEYTD